MRILIKKLHWVQKGIQMVIEEDEDSNVSKKGLLERDEEESQLN